MRKLRFLLAILLLLSTCTMAACKEKTPEATTPQATTPEQTTPEPDAPVVHAKILLAALADYEIIYAKDSSQEVKDEVKKLVNAIFDSFGVMLNQRSDLFYEGVESLKKGQYEILIGCTNREESDTLLQDWYAAQDKQYTTTPEPLVKKDIRMILDWTFSDKCQVQPAKRKPHSAQPAIITAEDMARVLSIRGDISRRFLFYITVWNKVYGLSRASSNFIGQVIGGTDRAIRKTVKNFREKGYITVRNGVTTNKGGYVAEANSYFVNEFEGVEIPDEVRGIQIEIDTAKVNDAFEVQYCTAIDAFGEWAERHLTPKERRARGGR